MLNTNILYLIFYLIFSLFPQLTAVDDVLHGNMNGKDPLGNDPSHSLPLW